MIIVVVIVGTADFHEQRIGAPGGSGFPAVSLDDSASGIVLAHQPFVAVMKVSSVTADLFLKAPAERIVVILGYDTARSVLDPHEPVFWVVKELGHHPTGIFLDHVAVEVVIVGHIVVAAQLVILVVGPLRRGISSGQAVAHVVVGERFVVLNGIVRIGQPVQIVVSVAVIPVLGGLGRDVVHPVILVGIVQHRIGRRVAGCDLLYPHERIVIEFPGTTAGQQHGGRTVPFILTDGHIARIGDLHGGKLVVGIVQVAVGDGVGRV